MKLTATFRIVLGLSLVLVSVLATARAIGLGPQEERATMRGRSLICESLAISSSVFVASGNLKALRQTFSATCDRNPDIVSAAIRRANGELLVEVGDHAGNWTTDSEHPTDTQMFVPILAAEQEWGTVEVSFRPLAASGLWGILTDRWLALCAFIAAGSALPFYIFLRRSLQHMDPSKVVPERVRAALNSLAGGLLVLDNHERIVLANDAFAAAVGRTVEKLQGMKASLLPWDVPDPVRHSFPWQQAIRDRMPRMGVMIKLQSDGDDQRSYLVNSTPIQGQDGKHRGVLASFEDITQLERRKWELTQMLDVLRSSRDEVRRKNEELRVLATQDPLTGCMNRRSFFELFETHWQTASEKDIPLSCLILDVDHFKSVNDTYGHSVGDDVLRVVASTMQQAVGERDVLCRYGGEEFCVLLPGMDLFDAARTAERYRAAIEELEIGEPKLKITASFGTSTLSLGAASPQELLDQADKCLYVAKRNGRNQVVRWDMVPDDVEVDESRVSRTKGEEATFDGIPALEPTSDTATIPFHAVSALMSAMSFRNSDTADHCRRVADLCVAAANGLLSTSDSYVLEIAALLHDIGKIGVPDSILLKPGRLSPDEREVMKRQERIGVEIVSSTFSSRSLVETLELRGVWFGGRDDLPGAPRGESIPVSARLLAIADAYDSMVTDRVFRAGCSADEAFAELRRCAGQQFDPELVERFIDSVQANDASRHAASAGRLAGSPPITRDAAVQIGTQIERLIQALDNEDLPGLATLAGRMSASSALHGEQELSAVAGNLQAAACEQDVRRTVELTSELMEICRQKQRTFLSNSQRATSHS